jgi:hypothetical protein
VLSVVSTERRKADLRRRVCSTGAGRSLLPHPSDEKVKAVLAAFLDGEIILDLQARLGKPIKGMYEVLRAFRGLAIRSARYDADFRFDGTQTTVPAGVYRL